jgi:hypothetical protein
MMNVSKHESGVITNGGNDSIDSLYSVFYCYPKSDTDEGNFIVFPYMK